MFRKNNFTMTHLQKNAHQECGFIINYGSKEDHRNKLEITHSECQKSELIF